MFREKSKIWVSTGPDLRLVLDLLALDLGHLDLGHGTWPWSASPDELPIPPRVPLITNDFHDDVALNSLLEFHGEYFFIITLFPVVNEMRCICSSYSLSIVGLDML